MNILEEKGISKEFLLKLSQLSTAYEHSASIDALEELTKFIELSSWWCIFDLIKKKIKKNSGK
jgi:hypothetical protein